MILFQAYIKEASLHPSQVLVNAGSSKSFGSKNISKEAISENSIDSDASNSSSSVSNNKKDNNNNNNMPVEQLTSHMLSSSSRLIPATHLAFCCLLKTIADLNNGWLRLAFGLVVAFTFSLPTSINLS